MQYSTNTSAVGQFNMAAPALESTVIKGVTYEVFHDFYHQRPVGSPFGTVIHNSVGFRIAGKPESFNFSSYAFMRRCKTQQALQAWMDTMNAKYGCEEVL